jgi:hypothetical protein
LDGDGHPIPPQAGARRRRTDFEKEAGAKEVPIVSELAYVLLAHGRRLGKLVYLVGADAWLFPSRNGQLKQPSSLVKAIKRSADEAGSWCGQSG